jgi:predicted type IV restriction endonuclease
MLAVKSGIGFGPVISNGNVWIVLSGQRTVRLLDPAVAVDKSNSAERLSED